MMGQVRNHPPAMLLCALISRHQPALAWAQQRIATTWGPIVATSPEFYFTETEYYRSSMGPDLRKQFVAIQGPFDPAQLADVKLTTNRWEQDYAATHPDPFPRPLNLDPGYLTEAKLVLATTKDRDHRIYLHSGIFAEITLHYHGGRWQPSRWTYPDYQRADY
ncbi:MAG TPA: DUF4416 family protein, partial [Pirellulaceae bacterium]|nr:DUF4416 family protein [Pirellulaceae bacterium]